MGKICDGDTNLRIISESNVFKTIGSDEISSETGVDRFGVLSQSPGQSEVGEMREQHRRLRRTTKNMNCSLVW